MVDYQLDGMKNVDFFSNSTFFSQFYFLLLILYMNHCRRTSGTYDCTKNCLNLNHFQQTCLEWQNDQRQPLNSIGYIGDNNCELSSLFPSSIRQIMVM